MILVLVGGFVLNPSHRVVRESFCFRFEEELEFCNVFWGGGSGITVRKCILLAVVLRRYVSSPLFAVVVVVLSLWCCIRHVRSKVGVSLYCM